MSNKDNNNIMLTTSPCVGSCRLASDDICLGCFRHIDEVVGWQNFSNEVKKNIVSLCQQRQDSRESKPNS